MSIGGQCRDSTSNISGRFRQRKVGWRCRALRSLNRLTPVAFGDAEVVEHHLRAKPPRRDRDSGGGVLLQFMPLRKGQPIDGHFRQIVENRDSVVRCVVSAVPSVTSMSSPPGLSMSRGSRWWEVIRCVSIASRSIRRPSLRLCFQIGVFQSAGPPFSNSPPQMSLTSTSMWPCSFRIRSARRLTCSGSR